MYELEYTYIRPNFEEIEILSDKGDKNNEANYPVYLDTKVTSTLLLGLKKPNIKPLDTSKVIEFTMKKTTNSNVFINIKIDIGKEDKKYQYIAEEYQDADLIIISRKMDNIYKICNILQTTEFGIYQIWVSGDNTAYLNYFIFDGKFEAINYHFRYVGNILNGIWYPINYENGKRIKYYYEENDSCITSFSVDDKIYKIPKGASVPLWIVLKENKIIPTFKDKFILYTKSDSGCNVYRYTDLTESEFEYYYELLTKEAK